MSEQRETLNDRYMVYTNRQTHEMASWGHFHGWYVLIWKMEKDGIDLDDLGTRSKDGYSNPILHWKDNDSIYVDHEL